VNADEALALCRYVKACCPQQAIDEYTPLAWAEHLADIPYVDAKEACRQITAKQPFVTIAEVLAVVKSMRAKRIAEAGDLCPPSGMSEAEERAWIGMARRQIANGQGTPDVDFGELRERHLPDIRELLPSPRLADTREVLHDTKGEA